MLYFITKYRARPLKRHRHNTITGHTYDPSAADKKEWLALALPHKPSKPLEGPLRCTVVARIKRPKKPTHSYAKSVGDVDNIAKFFLDAMNTLFFVDDAQIVELTVRKCYSEDNEVSIMLERADGDANAQPSSVHARKRTRRI